MKFVSKAAAFGAAAAISATGLVAATGTTANAATVTKSVSYTCDLSTLGQGSQPITAAYTVPVLPATLPSGAKVPAQPVSAKITVSPAISTLISQLGSNGGKLSGSVAGDVKFGAQNVASTLTIKPQAVQAGAASTVTASGTFAAFSATTGGTQAVSLPSVVTASLDSVLGPQTVTCKANSGSSLSLGSVTVANTLAVSAPKKAKLHHAVKVKVTTNLTGKAVAKIKGKKVASATIKSGKATLKIKKGLKKGANKIVVSVGSLKKTVKVKVK